MMFVIHSISSKVQPKYLIMAGALIIAASMYVLTTSTGISTSGSLPVRECISGSDCR